MSEDQLYWEKQLIRIMSLDLFIHMESYIQKTKIWLAQLTGAVEYIDCISAVGYDSPNKCPGCDTKQYDGEAPAMLELWGMWSTPLLPSLLGPLWTW